MQRAASFRSTPSPTPHQQRAAAAQRRKQQLALQRSRSSRNVHGFDLSAHAELNEAAPASSPPRGRKPKKASKSAKASRSGADKSQNRGSAAESSGVPAAEMLFRVQPEAQLVQPAHQSKQTTMQRLSRAALVREIPPVLSSWQGHVPSQYPLLWGGTRKGLSRWPTVGAGEGLCGVMGQDVSASTGGAQPAFQASILRYYAERKGAPTGGDAADPSGSGLREKAHLVHPGGVLMSLAATPAAPPRLHGGGTAQGETPHPLTGQAVLPPNVLTRLTPKQRLALGKQQLKQQAEDIATLIQTYARQAQTDSTQDHKQRTEAPVRSARPVSASGLFAGACSPIRAGTHSGRGQEGASALPRQHPFDASWGGVLPAKEQVQARDNHAAAVQLELQARRRWLQRGQFM